MITIKIRRLRATKGWTQRQLADAAGISKSQLDRIEKNESMPTIDKLCDIAHALGVPAEETYEYRYIEKNPQSG